MLRLQLQKLHDRTRFLTKLVGVSVALHVVACLSLFFYQTSGGKITFDTKRMLGKDVIVKVVPFGQKKPAATLSKATMAVAAAGGKKANSKKTALAPAKKPDTKKTAVKKQDKKATTVAKKAAPKKGAQKKTEKKKIEPAKKKNEKAVAAAPAAAKKELKEEQAVQNPPVAQPAAKTEPVPEPVAQQTVPAVQEAQQVASEAPVPQAVVAAGQQQVSAEENVLYVDQTELAEIEIQRLLAQAVTQAWHPPVGVPAHIQCQALIEVDWQGVMTSYKLTQTSGIMIYDVSVEEGIKALIFPRAVWGKTIELIFKPWSEAVI